MICDLASILLDAMTPLEASLALVSRGQFLYALGMHTSKHATPAMKGTMPVQYLKGVGPSRAQVFEKLGVQTVHDLLEYYPRDWVFAPEPIKMDQLAPGETVTIVGLIESTDYRASRRTPWFEAMVADDTGILRIIWFNGGYLQKQLQPGQVIVATGKVVQYKHQLQMTSPKFMIVHEKSPNPADFHAQS